MLLYLFLIFSLLYFYIIRISFHIFTIILDDAFMVYTMHLFFILNENHVVVISTWGIRTALQRERERERMG